MNRYLYESLLLNYEQKHKRKNAKNDKKYREMIYKRNDRGVYIYFISSPNCSLKVRNVYDKSYLVYVCMIKNSYSCASSSFAFNSLFI